MHMRVGQCILLPEDKSATTATTLEKTSCTREHDAEVFAVASAPDGDFPGAEALNRQDDPDEGFVGTKRSFDRVPGASVGPFEADPIGEGVGPVGSVESANVIGWCVAAGHAPPDTFSFYLLRWRPMRITR